MHPLVNRSLQSFLQDTYGEGAWRRVALSAGLPPDGLEALVSDGAPTTERLVHFAGRELGKPVDALLEDLGTYLVSHPNTEAVRRLLRFSGESFEDFLHSLEDLPGRARLAVADLVMPPLDIVEESETRFRVTVRERDPGFAAVLTGVLRAMADDYGALVLLEAADEKGQGDGSRQTGDGQAGAVPDAGDRVAEGAPPPLEDLPLGLRHGHTGEIVVHLLDRAFAEGRRFELTGAGARS